MLPKKQRCNQLKMSLVNKFNQSKIQRNVSQGMGLKKEMLQEAKTKRQNSQRGLEEVQKIKALDRLWRPSKLMSRLSIERVMERFQSIFRNSIKRRLRKNFSGRSKLKTLNALLALVKWTSKSDLTC